MESLHERVKQLAKTCYSKKSLYDKQRKLQLKTARTCTSCAKKPALEGNLCGNCSGRQYESSKDWPSNQPDQKKSYHLLKQYGMTIEDKRSMLKLQDYLCPVCLCSVSENDHVDHNHETNQVREILCGNCNRMIGLAKEDITRLENAITYLEKYVKEVKHDPELQLTNASTA